MTKRLSKSLVFFAVILATLLSFGYLLAEDEIPVVDEPVPPQGNIVSPESGLTATTTIIISVDVTDPGSGIANVLFYLSDGNGTLLGEVNEVDENGLYTLEWNSSEKCLIDGDHYIYVVLLGTDGGSYIPPWVLVKTDSILPTADFNYDPDLPTLIM